METLGRVSRLPPLITNEQIESCFAQAGRLFIFDRTAQHNGQNPGSNLEGLNCSIYPYGSDPYGGLVSDLTGVPDADRLHVWVALSSSEGCKINFTQVKISNVVFSSQQYVSTYLQKCGADLQCDGIWVSNNPTFPGDDANPCIATYSFNK
jgi:hypothetical protein